MLHAVAANRARPHISHALHSIMCVPARISDQQRISCCNVRRTKRSTIPQFSKSSYAFHRNNFNHLLVVIIVVAAAAAAAVAAAVEGGTSRAKYASHPSSRKLKATLRSTHGLSIFKD